MNDTERRLSAMLDALTELQESMDQHHGHAVGVVPIDRWEDLTANVRECVEELVDLVRTLETDHEERSAA